MPAPLVGYRVLVTRPAHQAEHFCHSIEQAGGIAIRFPTIDICPKEHPSSIPNPLQNLEDFSYAIFVSSNAVDQTFKRLETKKLPESLQCVAVGKKTALALKRHGQSVAIAPTTDYTSEALLAHPKMQLMQNQSIIIFRGEGGRELLAETLRERGASVRYAEVYRRCLPDYSDDQVTALTKENAISVITITSAESLNNLAILFDRVNENYLRNLPLIVGSDRILKTAHQLGFKQPLVVAHNPSDEAMLQALLGWARTH